MKLFEIFSSELHYKILKALKERGGLSVDELKNVLEIPYFPSKQLKELEENSLISREKKGLYRICEITEEGRKIVSIREELMDKLLEIESKVIEKRMSETIERRLTS